MRKCLTLLLALLLCVSLATPVLAVDIWELEDSSGDLSLIDEADLLTDREEERLLSKLQKLSEQYETQVAVVTVSEIDDDIDDFVEELYDYLDYGYGSSRDGILLLVCMDPREARILSNGESADAITMDAIDSIYTDIRPELSDGNYAEAFDIYLEQCEYYLDGHENGFPFDVGEHLVIALIIGAVVGLIVVLVLKGQLKSVHRKNHADAYVRPGTLNITLARDIFLYWNISRREKPQNNSSSGSHSSGSRNVGGGRF